LLRRIPRLLSQSLQIRHQWPSVKKRCAAVAMIVVGAISLGAVSGQTPESKVVAGPTFEVVSVKPSGPAIVQGSPGERSYSRMRPFLYSDRSLTGMRTLKGIIQEAYSAEDWAVEGPGWYNEETYDIRATMPPNTSKEVARLMLQTMLAERFGLKFHREERDISVYALVEAKQGFKLRPVSDDPKAYCDMADDHFTATGTLDYVKTCSRRFADKPVVNLTGIEGIYHLELHWPSDPDRDAEGPRFWAALEKQVGLKRESRKVPRDVIVVDHVERVPTPN